MPKKNALRTRSAAHNFTRKKAKRILCAGEKYKYIMAERFRSKGGFVLASVGAAVGLGNALRFPGLCAKYGGGAFLLVYSIALIVLGVPLLNAEIALGRKIRGGAPECMKGLFRGGEKLGWAQCANSVFSALLYTGLAGWIFAEGFTVFPLCLSGASRAEAGNYFFENVLKSGGNGVISGISPLILICIAAVWGLMFVCLKGGASALANSAKFTVFLPVTLLSVIAVRGLFYSNSNEALFALFVPDFSKLHSPEIWVNALGQVFFSLSLGVGIMPLYGAYLPERCAVFPVSLWIAAADAFVSVLASVAMFTTVYGCGLQADISSSGIITAFTVYPAAIVGLFDNPVICGIVGVLFYFSLTLMAAQAGVSMLEAAFAPVLAQFGLTRRRAAVICCAVLGTLSAVFATTAADVLVEIADLFINFYNVLALCILECLAIGLTKEGNTLGEEINRYCNKLKMPRRFFALSVKFLCPAVLVALAAPQFARLAAGLNYPAWAQFSFGWGASMAVAFAGFAVEYLSRERRVNQSI